MLLRRALAISEEKPAGLQSKGHMRSDTGLGEGSLCPKHNMEEEEREKQEKVT